VHRRQEDVSALAQRGRRRLAAMLDRADDSLAHTRARLLALSPAATLRRGYAIVQRADGTVVRSTAQVTPGERITIRLAEDQLTAVAEPANQPTAGQASTRDG
jgi:exodeoxyribonuclease VII large subunit